MDNHEISCRLQKLVHRRLDRLVLEMFPGIRPAAGSGPSKILSGPSWKRVEGEWAKLCEEVGISRGAGLLDICLFDPMPRGDSLEMTRETALKILTLGLP